MSDETVEYIKHEYDELVDRTDALLARSIDVGDPRMVHLEDAEQVVWTMANLRNAVIALAKRAARTHHNLQIAGAERDVPLSIAERFWGGWEPMIPDEDGFEYQWVCEWWVEIDGHAGDNRQDVEPMTPAEVEWFKARPR